MLEPFCFCCLREMSVSAEQLAQAVEKMVQGAKAAGSPLSEDALRKDVTETFGRIAELARQRDENTARGHAEIDARYYRGLRAFWRTRILAGGIVILTCWVFVKQAQPYQPGSGGVAAYNQAQPFSYPPAGRQRWIR